MLKLTTKAANHLRKVRKERGLDERAGARFVGKGGRVRLTFANAPQKGDKVVKGADIPVYVAPDVADTLDQSIIGARVQEGRTVLIFRRKAAAQATAAAGAD
jgi:Fe-S cluster assembly iron-binding protein IscA